MLNYTLPSYTFSIQEFPLKIQFTENTPRVYINHSLHSYLSEIKKRIQERMIEWNDAKIYTNPYEFIHTNLNGKISLTKIKPLSRSFYKLIEINKAYDINIKTKKSIKSLHLAEGPGGFIESVRYIREYQNSDSIHDIYIGMSLISTNQTIPSWDKLYEKYHTDKRIVIEYGPHNDGDLFSVWNFEYMVSKYKNSIQFITADGGFDFSKNYNHQEVNVTRLLYVQIIYAVMCQQYDGTFVMKIFDMFTEATIDLLYLLSMFYDDINICKPKTSRYANSERYLVCRKFRFHQSDCFYTTFKRNLVLINENKLNISRFFQFDHHYFFIKQIENINSIFGQQQIENISSTFVFMDNIYSYDMIDSQKKNIIQRCIEWCERHNIPYNEIDKFMQIKRNIPNGFFTRKYVSHTHHSA